MCCYFYVSDHVYCVVRHWAVLICQKKMYVHNRTRKITIFHLNTIERGMESLLSLLQKYKEILLQHYLKIFCLFNINKVFLSISKKNSLCLFLLTQEFRNRSRAAMHQWLRYSLTLQNISTLISDHMVAMIIIINYRYANHSLYLSNS